MSKTSLLIRLSLISASILLSAQVANACEKHGKKEQPVAETSKHANAEPKSEEKAEKIG